MGSRAERRIRLDQRPHSGIERVTLSDADVAELASVLGVALPPDELHEVALRLCVVVDAVRRIDELGIDSADADPIGPDARVGA